MRSEVEVEVKAKASRRYLVIIYQPRNLLSCYSDVVEQELIQAQSQASQSASDRVRA